MIYLNVQVEKKPVKLSENTTQYGVETKKISIDKIRCSISGYRYKALVNNPKIDAPYSLEGPKGEVWLHFYKTDNKEAKIPVLKDCQIIEV